MNEETKTFADYVEILKRRHMVIILTFILIFLPGVFITFSIEPVYRSTATFLVEQQSIPQSFAQTTVTGFTDEQLQETRQRVMSSNNLEMLIDKHNLFADKNAGSISTIERMQESIYFEPEVAEVVNERTGRTMLATITFDVSFDYSDPEIAQAVAADLAELYLHENEGNRLDQVRATIEFLESDIARLKEAADKAAQAVSDFRQRHSGNLPEQANYNLRAVERIERQIEQVEDDLRRARDRKLVLEGELLRVNPIATVYDAKGDPIRGTSERLSELQRERLRLLSVYSPEHPDVINVNNQIQALSGDNPGSIYVADINAQLEATRGLLHDAQQRYSDDHPDVIRISKSVDALEQQLANARNQQQPYRAETSLDPAVQQLHEQIQALDSDLQSFSQKRYELTSKISELESKMTLLPEIDLEFTALTRDSKLAEGRYNEALIKLDEAKVAERLETRGSAERIALITTPRVPSNPYEPNRTAILMLVVVLGLGVGIIVATVVDTLDDTVKSAADVLMLSNVPALAVIPFLETPGDHRRRLTRNFGLSALVLFSLVLAVIMSMTIG